MKTEPGLSLGYLSVIDLLITVVNGISREGAAVNCDLQASSDCRIDLLVVALKADVKDHAHSRSYLAQGLFQFEVLMVTIRKSVPLVTLLP
jgi:hypothetical protein